MLKDELNRIEQESIEPKPKNEKSQPSLPNQIETADLVGGDITEDTVVRSKAQKKKEKKKRQNLLENIPDLQDIDDTKDSIDTSQDTEGASSKKKAKKGAQKGPSSAVREKIKRALKEQEDADRLQREEEERKAREFEIREEERLAKLEKERLRKEKKKSQRKERITEQKLAGTYLTKEQKDKIKERQEKANAMQQAYGMTVGPNTEEETIVKIKYGARKRNKNKESRDEERDVEIDNGCVIEKEQSINEQEPVRDSWEDILDNPAGNDNHRQKIKDNWEDSDSISSESTDVSSEDGIEVFSYIYTFY
ncbi:hypothetical protein LOD99_9181 [Oopsacas minuta]|uniref:Uncharacterized protein n=1 Tax=Oopsacas minuta TaxID=111878 RepID=A0AAV7JDJ5_9METZ|nr:hypothetical protein LOD99_9181 [Oopsacas minuta]